MVSNNSDMGNGEGGVEQAAASAEFSGPVAEIRSVGLEIEELLPDGTRIRVVYTETSTLRRGRGATVGLTLKFGNLVWFLLVLLGVSVGIGLIAVGAQGVWDWLKEVTGRVVD